MLSPAADASGGSNPAPRSLDLGDPAAKLPDYATAYKVSIHEEFEYLKSLGAVKDENLRDRIDASLSNPQGTTWGDLFFIERTILRLQSDDVVRRRAWSLRDRFRIVIGEVAYKEYLNSAPPSADVDKPIEPLRQDLDRILCEFHWRYQTTPMREGERNRVTGRIAFLMFVGVALVLIAMYVDSMGNSRSGLSTVLMVLLMGAMGAFVSLQHRIQSVPTSGDAILNILSLREGWVSVFLSPLSGAVFAFVLFLAFSSGLLQGTLFPEVAKADGPTTNSRPAGVSRLKAEEAETAAALAKAEADKNPADADAQAKARELEKQAIRTNLTANAEPWGLSFLAFVKLAIPRTVSDLAKLLLWCFIAGFAERLIPDTLNRMIVRKFAVMEPEPASNTDPIRVVTAPLPQTGNGNPIRAREGAQSSPSPTTNSA
jgi:hypothetical protein